MLLGPIVDAPLEEWQRMVDINILGLLYCAHAALPHLLRAAEEAPRRVADLVNVSSAAGRQVRMGSGVYNLTKHGVGAFSESLRQEVTGRHVRVGLIEPGAVETELVSHNRPEIQEVIGGRIGAVQRMSAHDIAEMIAYIVTRPRHVAINEVLIRPTEQANLVVRGRLQRGPLGIPPRLTGPRWSHPAARPRAGPHAARRGRVHAPGPPIFRSAGSASRSRGRRRSTSSPVPSPCRSAPSRGAGW